MTRRDNGQALLLVLGALMAVLVGTLLLGGVAAGIGARADRQRAADLAALSGARALRAAYPRVFAPAVETRHLERSEYLALGAAAARDTAGRNGVRDVGVAFPGGGLAPVRVRVAAGDITAEAELLPPGSPGGAEAAGAGQYTGPLAMRQGHGMRPDVAQAFDRMAAAARRAGIALIVNSGFRGDGEQARLFSAHPDPRWVAPPGHSLHRLATELDLGPPTAYVWLAAHAEAFAFVQRYTWEPWHYGFTRNAGTRSVGYGGGGGDGRAARTLPAFVPARYAPAIGRAAQRWSVSAALLAAQIYAESHFNPFARSAAGAQGIAQFMPATADAYGLRDPFDAVRAIDAQAHLMRDLLGRFAAVPLALAAYNAGPVPVARCMCVPAIAETQAYVASILGLLNGAGDPLGAAAGGLEVRLVA
ncbi:MAG: transglycosylase SLT domain-containing protein [Solirubrobacteraceae bacterium]